MSAVLKPRPNRVKSNGALAASSPARPTAGIAPISRIMPPVPAPAPAMPPTAAAPTAAPATRAAGGGDGGGGASAPPPAPATRLRMCVVTLHSATNPVAWVVQVVPVHSAEPMAHTLGPYSRSNCTAAISARAPSAMAVAIFSSMPTMCASQASTGAVTRTPPPPTRLSLMPATVMMPPAVWVSAIAPPRMVMSPCIVIDRRPLMVLRMRLALMVRLPACSMRLPPTCRLLLPVDMAKESPLPASRRSDSPRRTVTFPECSFTTSARVSSAWGTGSSLLSVMAMQLLPCSMHMRRLHPAGRRRHGCPAGDFMRLSRFRNPAKLKVCRYTVPREFTVPVGRNRHWRRARRCAARRIWV